MSTAYRAQLPLLIIALSLLVGSTCMHPATLRVAELNNAFLDFIPNDYYNYASIIPAGTNPYEWLEDLEWDRDYQANHWDCSTMALYIEWAMENAGVPAKVCLSSGHAWVQIWRRDRQEWWAYECVSLRWVNPWVQGRYYNPYKTFADVYELEAWYYHNYYFFALEWCWWADTSELLFRFEEA